MHDSLIIFCIDCSLHVLGALCSATWDIQAHVICLLIEV